MTARLAGCLTGPCVSANLGVGDILESHLFAFGVGSSITVVDLFSLKPLCTLQGGHGKFPVTALAWHPDCHSRDLRASTHLRLASGDGEGSVVLWDVLRDCLIRKLVDNKNTFEHSEGVKCLRWMMHDPSLLAVVLGPSTLVLWDIDRGQVVWHKDLAGAGSLDNLSVDPLDRRSLCLSGSNGVCLLISFVESLDRPSVKQYRVSNSGSEGAAAKERYNLHCMFCNLHSSLLVMLPSEILVFDVEFGQPLGSISLPKGFKPFKKLIGVYGYSTSYGLGHNGGTDVVYALHEDGSLSIWNRLSSALKFSLQSHSMLIPKPLRGMHGTQLNIMTSCGSLWRKPCPSDSRDNPKSDKTMMIVNVMTNGQVWRWTVDLPEPDRPLASPQQDLINFTEWDKQADALLSQLDSHPVDVSDKTPTEEPEGRKSDPELEQIQCSLSGSVTHISVMPVCLADSSAALPELSEPSEDQEDADGVDGEEELGMVSEEGNLSTPRILLPDQLAEEARSVTRCARMPLVAAATSTGSLELVSIQKGSLSTVSAQVVRSYSVHECRCRSVRWLGNGPLVATFSSEKVESLWINKIVLTDVRTGESVPFRVNSPETSNMLGIRASPGGKYLVVLLKEAPAEIWMVSDLWNVKRVRHLEIPFTAVDWALPEIKSSPQAMDKDWPELSGEEDLPLETLVFAVSDGRVGMISLQGKKVINSKVRLPGWSNIGPASSSNRCISIAAVGSLILVGDYEGNLIKWDLDSGKSESIFTDSGPVRRILINTYLSTETAAIRVGILSATWKCSVYDMDYKGKLMRTSFHGNIRLIDIAWIPSLHPSGISTMLAGITEEGNLVVLEADIPEVLKPRLIQQPNSLAMRKKESDVMSEAIDCLGGQASVTSTLALPKSLTLFLRLLIQIGLPASIFEAVVDSESSNQDISEIEEQIWDRLPVNLRGLNGQSPTLPSSYSFSSARSSADANSMNNSGEEKALTDARRRSRRRAALMEVSRGMSLATEVLKNIEAQNQRSRGLIGRVKGTFSRSRSARENGASAQVDERYRESEVAKQWQMSETLIDLLNVLAMIRSDGKLFLPDEWIAYASALEQNSTAARMAIAAAIEGNNDEVDFWSNLDDTLSKIRNKHKSQGLEEPGGSLLWDTTSTISAERLRAKLRDTIPRTHIEEHPDLQERRLVEYIALGDYHTAVGFLLSSAPEATVRYYRDSLCAYALSSVTHPEAVPVSPNGSPLNLTGRNTLHLQVAKVVSAHAASMGDSLLGVPLLCAAGLHHEAVRLLQDASLWTYAAVLTAAMLEGSQFAVSCLRWAHYVWKKEGSLWRAVGILTTGGCLREAAQVLSEAGYPDCAAAYCSACEEFGLVETNEDGLVQLFTALPGSQFSRVSSISSSSHKLGEYDDTKFSMTSIMNSFSDYITALLTGL